jgi:preprotein translocase subunit SecF
VRFHFHFMARRRLFLGLSGLLLLLTIVSLATRGLNFGIDFRGGVVMQIQTPRPVTIGDLRAVLQRFGQGNAQIQELNHSPESWQFQTLPMPDSEAQAIFAAMQKQFGPQTALQSENTIEPIIGNELRVRALLAIAIATVLMTAYLALRFQVGDAGGRSGLNFALGAVIALLHDITLTVGLFSVFHIQVNSPFVAAILTVYGYSMNDTIIVFDRIRERLRQHPKESLQDLIDVSLNQVLNRTITTVSTVILALLAVILLGGGGDMRSLAVALLVGVSFGTYSSIFIASPVFLWLATRENARRLPSGARAARA